MTPISSWPAFTEPCTLTSLMNSLSRLSLGLLAASLGVAEGAALIQMRNLAYVPDGDEMLASGWSGATPGSFTRLNVTAVIEKAGGSFASDEDTAQGDPVDPGRPVFHDGFSHADDPFTTLTLAQATLSAIMEEALVASIPSGTLDFFSLNPGATAETDATITVSSVISAYVGGGTFLRNPDAFRPADATGAAGTLHQALTMSDVGVERWRR